MASVFFLCFSSLYAQSLEKAGDGLCILRGNSDATLPDPFILTAGTLQVETGDNIGSTAAGQLTIATATMHITGAAFTTARTTTITGTASLDIDTGTTTFNNTINGGGNLLKLGAGTFVIPGLATLANTTVDAGTLQLTGDLNSPIITVNAGGTFSGTGTATGTFSNFGTVAPGASIGVLHVVGPYTQETGSTLEIEFRPDDFDPATLDADLLDVTGPVVIEPGATLALFPEPGEYDPLTTYLIVQSGDSVSNTFDTVTTSLPAFDAHVVYTATQVLLLINLVPFSVLVPTGNAAAVARCLDAASPPDGSDLRLVIEFLQFMDLPQIIDTMNQMNSALYNVLDLAQEETLIEVHTAISRRLADIQRKACADPMKTEGWTSFLFERTQQNMPGENAGYQTRARGVVAGGDGWISKHCLVGGLFSYSRNDITWQQQRGFAAVDTYAGGIYAAGKNQFLYYQGGAFGFYDEYRGARIITFPTTLIAGSVRTANYDNNGWGGSAYLETGFMPLKKREEIHPFGRVDYAFAYRPAFQDRGAGSIDLDIASHNSDLLRSEVGFQFSKCHQARSDSLWFPHAKLSWIYEKHFLGKYSSAHFIVSDCNMNVKGLSPTRSLLGYGAGLDVRGWSDHFFLGVECDGQWSKKYWGYTFSAQLKLGF